MSPSLLRWQGRLPELSILATQKPRDWSKSHPPGEFWGFAEHSRGGGAHADMFRGISLGYSTGKQSFIYLNIDCTPTVRRPMASNCQYLHLFAEDSLWLPGFIEPLQDKPEVIKSSCPDSSPHPVTDGRWWIEPISLTLGGIFYTGPRTEPQLPAIVTCS